MQVGRTGVKGPLEWPAPYTALTYGRSKEVETMEHSTGFTFVVKSKSLI